MQKNKKQLANELAGSGPAGDLLYRLCYWWPKARVVKHGHTWIARRREDMAAECGLSVPQYRRGLARLTELRLVASCQGQFAGRNISHLRLTEKACQWFGFEPRVDHLGGPESNHLGRRQSNQLGDPGSDHSYTIRGCNYGDDTTCMQSELTLAPGQETAQGIPREVQEGQNDMPFPKKGHLARDVIKPTVHEKKHGPDSVAKLEHVWKTELASVAKGGCAVAWTMKQKGMAKHLMKACAAHPASEVLRFAIHHWPSVCSYAQHDHGLKVVPGQPDLPFLLANIQSAINCMLVTQKQQAKSMAPLQSIVINPLPQIKLEPRPEDPEDKILTFEEAKALMGGEW